MFDLMTVITFQEDGDDIKTGWRIVQSSACQPGEGGFTDLALFERGDGKLRWAVGKGFTGFYLDKNEGVAIFGNNVYFAPLAAKIPLDDLQAAAQQIGCCQFFTAVANTGVLMSPTDRRHALRAGGAICPSHGNI